MRAVDPRRRREAGQIVPLFLLGLVGFVLLVVMILNTGQEVVRRTEVQNAADAAAITQASWTARSLNLIAMNQVALTQSFTVSVVSASFAQVIAQAQAETLYLYYEYAKICAATLGLGCAPLAHLVPFVQVPLGALFAKDPAGRSGDFRALAIAMADMNGHLQKDFPRFAEQRAAELAKVNLVDPPLFYPPERSVGGRSTPLPIEVGRVDLPPYGPFRLCRTAEEGTTSGGVFGNFKEHGRGQKYKPYPIARRDAGGNQTLLLALQSIQAHTLLMKPYKKEFGAPKSQTPKKNSVTRNLDQWWKVYCVAQTPPSVLPLGITHFPLPPMLSLYKIEERPLLPGRGLLTPQSTRDGMSLLAFTQRRTKAAILPARFNKPVAANYAYAQAEVYSAGGSYDLFTQDWKARLVPAGLLEREHTQVVQAVSAWQDLRGYLAAVAPGDWEAVNAH